MALLPLLHYCLCLNYLISADAIIHSSLLNAHSIWDFQWVLLWHQSWMQLSLESIFIINNQEASSKQLPRMRRRLQTGTVRGPIPAPYSPLSRQKSLLLRYVDHVMMTFRCDSNCTPLSWWMMMMATTVRLPWPLPSPPWAVKCRHLPTAKDNYTSSAQRTSRPKLWLWQNLRDERIFFCCTEQ